jgi:hypothetical protein
MYRVWLLTWAVRLDRWAKWFFWRYYARVCAEAAEKLREGLGKEQVENFAPADAGETEAETGKKWN